MGQYKVTAKETYLSLLVFSFLVNLLFEVNNETMNPRVFDKIISLHIFSLHQIGSGQALAKPMYFYLLQPHLRYYTF